MNRDPLERRLAFTGLLANPVLDRHSSPELWPLVRRHRSVLADWFASRLGYRLVLTDQAARLFRLPLGDRVVAPHRFQPPTRRVLVLAILAAAAAEDAEDVTTTQDLSDRVRALSQHQEVKLARYDPDRFAERLLFIKAVQVLVSVGALRPTGRGDEEQREDWTHRRGNIGGAYEVRRELLLRMIDPASLRAATEPGRDEPLPASAARFGLMRRLVELPVCLYRDLTEAERVYLGSQRRRLLAWCAEMTGWTAEQRTEGVALIAAEESDTDLPFPRLRAADFAALIVLDQLVRGSAGSDSVESDSAGSESAGSELVDRETIERAAVEVRARYPKAMTIDLRAEGRLASTTIELLTALDLLRPAGEPGTWRLMPPAARFRNPTVVLVTASLNEGFRA